MENYFLPALMGYFNEVNSICGRMSAVTYMLPEYQKQWRKDNRNVSRYQESGSVYRDLSIAPGKDNLFMPDVHYEITTENFADEVENLISLECGHGISRLYETFESYFSRILALFYFKRQNQLVTHKLLDSTKILFLEEIEELLKSKRGVNNKGLINLMRKISSDFRLYEDHNCFGVNMVHWFDLLSVVRHSVVHSRHAISDQLREHLEKHGANGSNELFDRHYDRKIIDNKVSIFFTVSHTLDVFCWLNSFAHLIYTCLAGELELPIEVPQYKPAWRQF